jgi:hypothetical protein
VSPRDELLSTNRLGPEGAQLLYRTVRLVAISHNFPPPGGTAWDSTAVAEVAHDFLQGQRGTKRLLDIAIRSTDDASFEKLLDAAVLNFLRDLARSTDMGKLILRIKEILRDEDAFEAVLDSADRWTLAGGPQAASAANPISLAAATRDVEVLVPKWTSTRRDAPLADRPSFVRLITSVLTAAAGSLEAVDLAHAITARLDHRRTAQTVSLDVLEQVSEPGWLKDDPVTRTQAQLHALDIFDSLSDRERIIVPTLDSSVRDLGLMLGTGKTQAALIRQRLIDRLRDELSDDEDPDGTATVLCELCEQWLEDRTRWDGTTSSDR